MTAKKKVGEAAGQAKPKPTPKSVGFSKADREAERQRLLQQHVQHHENQAAMQREELLSKVAEAHALPHSKSASSTILPCPTFLLDIEGLDVIATSAISSVSILYMDASLASPSDLCGAVSDLAFETYLARRHHIATGMGDCGTQDKYGATVSARSWTLDVHTQIRRYGRTVCPQTQAWWMNASPETHAGVSLLASQGQPKLHSTLNDMCAFIRYNIETALRNLSLEDSEQVMRGVRFVVRGSQYDAAALESLFQQVLGMRPAVHASAAFSEVLDPDTGGLIRNLWFYRSVTEIRSYLDGYRSGLLVASGDRKLVDDHLKAGYRAAESLRQNASNEFAETVRTGAFVASSDSLVAQPLSYVQDALELRKSGGRHVGEFDSLYDALLILPTLNGSAARYFAERQYGSETAE